MPPAPRDALRAAFVALGLLVLGVEATSAAAPTPLVRTSAVVQTPVLIALMVTAAGMLLLPFRRRRR